MHFDFWCNTEKLRYWVKGHCSSSATWGQLHSVFVNLERQRKSKCFVKAVFQSETHIFSSSQGTNKSQETTKVLRAACWIVLLLKEASVLMRALMRAFSTVCTASRSYAWCIKRIVQKKSNQVWIWLGFYCLDLPVEAFDDHSWEIWNQRSLKSHVTHVIVGFNQWNDVWISRIIPETKEYSVVNRNLISKHIQHMLYSDTVYMFVRQNASTLSHVCYIHRMYRMVLSLQTENYRSPFLLRKCWRVQPALFTELRG